MRRPVILSALLLPLLVLVQPGPALATGAGGWEHLGDGGTPSTNSLNVTASSLNADRPGALLVGGGFTDAGGVANADRVASWNGTAWSAVSSSTSQISNGSVMALAYDGTTGHVFAGGTFTDAGGNALADFLAVWSGTAWGPACNGSTAPITGLVTSLQIIGRTLYVGGSFQDAANLPSADYLVACDLDTGAPSSTVVDPLHPFSGPVYALTADSAGRLYAGGRFGNLENLTAADNVAFRDSTGWHAMGTGGGACGCVIDDFVRSLTAIGTDVFVGTDARDVAGIAQADNVVRWNGTSYSAVGASSGGTDGWFTPSGFVYGMSHSGSTLYVTGSFQNANGDPTADNVAMFDGAWHSVGSDGAGNGPWNGTGLALAAFAGRVHAVGSFTSAGGDTRARFIARFPGDPSFKLGTGTVAAGQSTKVVVTGAPGDAVDVLVKGAASSAYTALGTLHLNTAGVSALTIRPSTNSSYKIRTPLFTSPAQALIVKAVQSLVATASGRTGIFTGHVAPSLVGRTVLVYYYVDGGHATLAGSAKTTSGGQYRITHLFAAGQTVHVFAQTNADAFNAAGRSPLLTLTLGR